MDLKEKARHFFERIWTKEFLFVFLIFVLAFALRSHLMVYELFFEFDTYFHARMGEFVIQNFSIPTQDWLAYYQFNTTPLPAQGAFFWFFTALIYKVFTFWMPYDKTLWIGFVKILPAIFGALTSVAVYFLGREAYDKKTGLIMAFFTAVIPAFVYRTMAGQFEEDSLGFLWMVIGLTFVISALKQPTFNKKTISHAVIAGVFFGIMAWTWEMFLLIPMILTGYAIITVAVMWFKGETKEKFVEFIKVLAVAFAVFSLLAIVFTGTNWINRTIDYVVQYAPITKENLDRASQRGEGVLAATVGEEGLGYVFWFEKYNAMIIFPFIALLLIPLKIFKRNDKFAALFFVWIAITMFMAFHKLKFTYTFGIPIAIAGGIIFHEILIFVKKRDLLEKKVIMTSFALLALIGIAAASVFTVTKLPTIEQNDGWKETLYWMSDNTPEGSKMFNWWDQGHWIAFIGERRPMIDNRNLDIKADGDYGLFILSESEDEAYNIVKKYDSDYVIVSNDILSKASAIGLYAYNTTNYLDPRLTKYQSIIFPCGQATNELTQQKTYSCGSNNLNEQQINSLPSKWVGTPNQLIEQQFPGFVYVTPNKDSLMIFNQASNNSFGVRLWLNDPSITKFEEVFYNKAVKVFKVK